MNIDITGKKVFFTSDTHYGHVNICRGVSKWNIEDPENPGVRIVPIEDTRDFPTLEEMNETIVKNINDTVGEDDILFHTGDWSFGGIEQISIFRKKIKCKNVYLTFGNHDEHFEKQPDLKGFFVKATNYLEVTLVRKGEKKNDKNWKLGLVLFHYPIISWNNMKRNHFMLHGHVHSSTANRLGNGKRLDIGLDGHPNFRPYSLEEVLDLLGNREFIGNHDHHMRNKNEK